MELNYPKAYGSCAVEKGWPVNIHDVCIGVDGCKLYGQEQNMLHMSPLLPHWAM